MLPVCAAKALLPFLAAWTWSGQPDALRYVDAAKMFEVPPAVLLASKWLETRRSTRNTEVSRAGALGAMQIMPAVWNRRCGRVWGARNYERNIACGALIWRYYLSRCNEDVRCAGWHYVGGDRRYADAVAQNALVLRLQCPKSSAFFCSL